VQGAEPPVVVVVGAWFFLPLLVVVLLVVVVVGIGEVGDWIETAVCALAALVLVSPLESEPQPAGTARSAAAPSAARSDRPARIGRESS
jgi:hypothetical protein